MIVFSMDVRLLPFVPHPVTAPAEYYTKFIPALKTLDATQARVSSNQKANRWMLYQVFTGRAFTCEWGLAEAGHI